MKKQFISIIAASLMLTTLHLSAGLANIYYSIAKTAVKAESSLFGKLLAVSSDKWISRNLIPRGWRLSDDQLNRFYDIKEDKGIARSIVIAKSDTMIPRTYVANYESGSILVEDGRSLDLALNSYASKESTSLRQVTDYKNESIKEYSIGYGFALHEVNGTEVQRISSESYKRCNEHGCPCYMNLPCKNLLEENKLFKNW